MEQQTALREFYVDDLRAICNCDAGSHLTLALAKTSQTHETDTHFHGVVQQQRPDGTRRKSKARA
jgi:hypothetical protein